MGSHTVSTNISCPCTVMSAWWWLHVTETCSKLYIIEYIVVFWLNDFLVGTKTQRNGSYQKILASQVWTPLYVNARHSTRSEIHCVRADCIDVSLTKTVKYVAGYYSKIYRFLVSNGNAVQKSVLINQGVDAEVLLLLCMLPTKLKKCQKSQACRILDAPRWGQ